MKYFVYYDDDYPDNGGIGLESFDDEKSACTFIEERIQQDPGRELSCYTVIEGKKLNIETYEVVTRIKMK